MDSNTSNVRWTSHGNPICINSTEWKRFDYGINTGRATQPRLDLLVRYNAADTRNLEPLAECLFEQADRPIWPTVPAFLSDRTHMTPSMWEWTAYGRTDRGLVRRTNQDAFLVDNRHRLWAVADGMGGQPGGDVASRLVVDTLANFAPTMRTAPRSECHWRKTPSSASPLWWSTPIRPSLADADHTPA